MPRSASHVVRASQIVPPARERRVGEIAAAVAGAVEIEMQHVERGALKRMGRERQHAARLVELLGEGR